jgi:hypothetical protein
MTAPESRFWQPKLLDAGVYRFRTRRRAPELRFGLADRLGQDHGSCLSVCCT